MQKIVKLLLVGLLALTLAACESETIDAASIYQEAIANMSALDSYTMESKMVMTVGAASEEEEETEETTEEAAEEEAEEAAEATEETEEETEEETQESSTTIDMTYILVGLTSDSPSEYYSMTVSTEEEESTIERWFVDGVFYINQNDEKSTEEVEDVEVSSIDFFTFIEDTDNMTGTANEEGYSLEITIEGATFLEILDQLNEGSTSELLADATVEDSVIFALEINGDGYITSASVAVSIALASDEVLSLSYEFTYYDFDASVLPELDTESFDTTPAVNGEYDLTIDYIEGLVEAGYEEVEEYLYYDGTYIIDLELKQIISGDTIYDWELDQGTMFDFEEEFTFYCGFDFVNDIGDDDCDFTTIEELREYYNELASSIIGE